MIQKKKFYTSKLFLSLAEFESSTPMPTLEMTTEVDAAGIETEITEEGMIHNIIVRTTSRSRRLVMDLF